MHVKHRQLTRRARATLFAHAAVFVLAGLVSSPAFAAADGAYEVPKYGYTDLLGVDIGSSQFHANTIGLSIGDPAHGGLAWNYDIQWNGGSYQGIIEYRRYPAATEEELSHVKVNISGDTTTFLGNCVTTGCVNTSGNGATLVQSGSYWIFTDKAGAQFKFDTTASWSQATSTDPAIRIGALISIQYADGTLISINGTHNSGCTTHCGYTISNVVSNRGYALKGLSVVNLLSHTCDAAILCDAYDATITTGTATVVSGLSGTSRSATQIGDALGNSTYTSGGAINRPDLHNPNAYVRVNAFSYFKTAAGSEIEFTRDSAARLTTVKDNRGTWTYNFNGETLAMANTTSGWRVVSLYDPSNNLVYKTQYDKGTGRIYYIEDALARRTTYDIQWTNASTTSSLGYFRLMSLTKPEGNKTSYAYDSRGNVTSVTSTPKSGSGLTATSITASYPTTCTYVKTCNQPTWTKDAKGNQTDYTYDNTHGGVLTVTLPANNDAIRTRTYNTYSAFDTGNGIVYRLTRSETCGLTSAQLSLTACPADINTSVTITDYGTSSTAPYTYKSNLPYQVTKRDNRASGYDSQTTTYGYDAIGNVVSVDGPLAGAADQSFITYDANRRKIFEIGPIPGGTGTQKRSLVRHQYNGDGQETQTANGYANSNLTNGTDAVIVSYSQMTYDAVGRLIKTEVETTGNAVP